MSPMAIQTLYMDYSMNSCQKLMRSMLLLSVVDEEMLELARKSLSQQVVEPEFKLRVSASRV